ncbi:hypothetical protein OSJ77_17020 [Phyllobacterium sp. 0TCS1.6C]|uniref:hypothetical protein n=1 Tax=unclassified Phyllobacterium TaxID=2638441 RepID=UPI0022650F2F|nr:MULTISPECIES: hypothetical protein [unclassified Phyllobacterium]MCX8281896.1 hypothetical protein [Phyllobacterium sp. 0TCS1.6C]MCX8295431.1 hypothetical protein [Phyllobacterium sp. 0TCS1.6A]
MGLVGWPALVNSGGVFIVCILWDFIGMILTGRHLPLGLMLALFFAGLIQTAAWAQAAATPNETPTIRSQRFGDCCRGD